MKLPDYCDVKAKDVDLKRLGSVLWLAQAQQVTDFEDLVLLKGMGPRTLQALTLVSEVIHGTPSRFSDPARYSFAHGGKAGKPFPVKTTIYDETIDTLKTAVEKARIGDTDKLKAIGKLTAIAQHAESGFQPKEGRFDALLEKERRESARYGGRSVAKKHRKDDQLRLF